MIDTLEGLDEESFDVHFSERTWSVTLSDGSNAELRPNGANESVRYEERLEYARLAKQARMSESDKQVNTNLIIYTLGCFFSLSKVWAYEQGFYFVSMDILDTVPL